MSAFLRVLRCFLEYATVLALCLGLCFALSGCRNSKKIDLFAYQNAPFFAEVKGVLNGESIQATVYCDRGAEGESPYLSVCYISPDSLRGLTVSLYGDGRSEARLGKMRKNGDFEALAEPFGVLCPALPYTRIEKSDCGTVVCFENEEQALRYYFNETDVLVRIEGEYGGVSLDLPVLSVKQIK